MQTWPSVTRSAAAALVLFFLAPAAAGAAGVCASEQFLHGSGNGTGAEIRFRNDRPSGINVYWIDESGNRVFAKTIAPHAVQGIGTSVGDPWVVTDDTGNCIGVWVAGPGASINLVGY